MNKSNDSLAGIYIHIPFCKQACHYCDFHFSTSSHLREQILGAISKELSLQQHFFSGHTVSTIYFGGGTPSLLTAGEIGDLLSHLNRLFPLASSPEITLESNPDDLSMPYLKDLIRAGINRLSIGVQSFQPTVLEWMNRAHNQQQAEQCIEQARAAGFENLSADLIYGIPLVDYSFESDLLLLLQFEPDHVSAYNLTIEPGTRFWQQLKKGKLTEASEKTAADSFLLAMKRLRKAGFQHYEISNFCRPGMESLHNLGYWNGDPYLGVGPSAHSFDGISRQYNISSNGGYVQALERNEIPFTIEHLTAQQRINELIMLGLRTSRGIELELEAGGFQWDLAAKNGNYLRLLEQNKLAVIRKNKLLLTDKGKLLADSIAEDLFIDNDEAGG